MIKHASETPVFDGPSDTEPVHGRQLARSAASANAIARIREADADFGLPVSQKRFTMPADETAPAEETASDQDAQPMSTPTNNESPAVSANGSAAASSHTADAETLKVTEKDLVQVFKLLADETRLKILLSLQREGELHVSALCDRLGQSQPAVSHHLALLRDADLIRPRRDGKHNYYSVRREHFATVMGGLFESMLESKPAV